MKKSACIFFGHEEHYELMINEEQEIQLTADVDGVVTEYDVTGGGGGVERKLLYTNPDPTAQMTDDTLFMETEIEGYDFLAFTVTTTTGNFEVEEWCEIEPLKALSGQFIISIPAGGYLYARKIYRSGGAVKPSVSVYEIGKTTGDRNMCIVKKVEAVKGVL